MAIDLQKELLASTRKWQEFFRVLDSHVAANWERLERAVAPLMEKQVVTKTLATSFELARIDLPSVKLERVTSLDLERIERITTKWEELQDNFSQFLVSVEEAFRTLPPRIQSAVRLLGQHGWYMDLAMPMLWLWELEDDLLKGDSAGAEEALCIYFEEQLDEIENRIATSFPNRAHLITAAFAAHRRGEYVLSIPLLLMQTDGICKEVTSHYLFRKRNKRPQTAAYVETVTADSLRAAILTPLGETLPISASEGERQPTSVTLNRHLILHGESLDYGTKVNGLKAISVLNYVVMVLGTNAKNSA